MKRARDESERLRPSLTGSGGPEATGHTPTPHSISQESGCGVGMGSQGRAAGRYWHTSAHSRSLRSYTHSGVYSWAGRTPRCGRSRLPGHTSDPPGPCRCQSQCHSAECSHSRAPCDGRRVPAESRALPAVWHTPYSSHSHPGPGWSPPGKVGGLQSKHRAGNSPGPLSMR